MPIIPLQILLVGFFFAEAEAIGRADFPDGFVFGTASSAYQPVELQAASAKCAWITAEDCLALDVPPNST
ncbi:hypothetical protein ACLOJK_020446 [Asimina triloba]